LALERDYWESGSTIWANIDGNPRPASSSGEGSDSSGEGAGSVGAEPSIRVRELVWGDSKALGELRAEVGSAGPDLVVGSDLIYAKEGIPPLVATYQALCSPSTLAYLVVIRRFAWEDEFFTLMEQAFTAQRTFEDGDIAIWTFKKRPAAAPEETSTTAASVTSATTTATATEAPAAEAGV